jgi:hypothetical protein
MKEINYKYRINQGWNNSPAEMAIIVDDKLHQLISIIQGGRSLSERPKGEHLYYKKLGVMSKDRGYGWANLSTSEHGQDIGMFYGGIAQGSEYVDLTMIRGEGEYRYADLLKVA